MKMNYRVFSFGNIWVTWKQIGTNPLGSLGSHHYLKLLHSYCKYKKSHIYTKELSEGFPYLLETH